MLLDSKPLRLIALSLMLSALPALAQFEVSPDHFDSPDQKTTKHKASNRTAHKPTRTQAASKTATRQGTNAKSKKQLKPGSASAKSNTPTT